MVDVIDEIDFSLLSGGEMLQMIKEAQGPHREALTEVYRLRIKLAQVASRVEQLRYLLDLSE